MSDDIRGQIVARLQELANKPQRSRTQRELQEARELLDVLKTKQEIYNYPKQSFFQSVKQNFDLAKLNEDIEDFTNPKRSMLKTLRQDVEIKELKERLHGPAKPFPLKFVFIVTGGILVFLFLAKLSQASVEVQNNFWEQISLPAMLLVGGIVAVRWLRNKK